MWEYLPVALSVIGSVMGAQGGMQAAAATQSTGARQQKAAQFEAAQLDQAAGQSIAASQRTALDLQRQGKLVASRMLAVSAAGGGGTGDTVARLISDVAGESAYRMNAALYQGEDRARQQRMAATAKRYEGDTALIAADNKAQAYETSAIGSLIKGTSSLFANYKGSGPPTAGTGTSGAPIADIGKIDWELT